MPEHPQAETERNVNTNNSPLSYEVNVGINSSEVTDTISPNLVNSMIDEAIKSPNSFEKALNDNDEESCRVREVGSNDVVPGSHANLSETDASQLNKSCASQSLLRASNPNDNRRVLPSWTCRSKPLPSSAPTQLKQITGKKREIETLEDHTELPHKRY